MRLTYAQMASCTGGSLDEGAAGERVATGLTWDSREVSEGDAYVALPGERVDGHDFVAAALRAGASGAVVAREPSAEDRRQARASGAALVRVADTRAALRDLAREWRGHLRGRVMGLTGSCGKTTTKNLVRDVLGTGGSVVATEANQNNELGVPRTVLAADEDTRAVVVEMGMRGLGQIAALCDVARPEWGIVTNVGESHIELLGSRENIASAKGELVRALPHGTGVAFLNGADDFADALAADAERIGVEAVCFDASGRPEATSSACAWRGGRAVWAEDVALDGQGRPRFTLAARGFAGSGVERHACALGLRGVHNVSNACCAAAVGLASGQDLDDVCAALASAQPESGRQEVRRTAGGLTVVDDAYNANPDSMRASLSTFCALEVEGRRIAVLGDMGELGDVAGPCHDRVGALVAALPIDVLIAVGELAGRIADTAEAGGMDPRRVARVADADEALAQVRAVARPGDAVLVKASHFMELQRVAEGLVD